MAVARFRRTKRGGRVGQRTIDDGERWLQRHSSKNCFPGNGPFLSTWDRAPKGSVSQSALEAARTVEEAVQARVDNGLATRPELLQAQQQRRAIGVRR